MEVDFEEQKLDAFYMGIKICKIVLAFLLLEHIYISLEIKPLYLCVPTFIGEKNKNKFPATTRARVNRGINFQVVKFA